VWAKVGEGGRVVIPAAYRRALGVEEGDHVQLHLEGDEVRIVSRAGAIARAQELVAKYVPPGVSLVDELIAERRREAAREERGE
jgi:AbrB family looped-hinge helix DNA binding protein